MTSLAIWFALTGQPQPMPPAPRLLPCKTCFQVAAPVQPARPVRPKERRP